MNMKIIFGKLVVSPANVLGTAMVVGYIAVSTLLFTHVSDRLDKALRRVDKLELFITNTIASQDTHIKERTLNWLGTVKDEIGEMEVRQTGKEEIVRTRRDDKYAASVNDKIAKIYAKVARVISRLKKIKKNNKAARKSVLSSRKKKRSEAPSKCNTTNGSNKSKKTHAWFTIWGSRKCLSGSRLIQKGQMVTNNGSDYLCLPDKGEGPFRYKSNRMVHEQRSVKIQGVTYGDIEDVFSFNSKPLPANESKTNYMLVPCAVCSRADKTASIMLLSSNDTTLNDHHIKREYVGMLMSTKQSNTFACVSLNPQTYRDKMEPLVDPVQLHPVELKCDSLYCKASSKYEDKHRILCVVGTI